MKENPTNRDKNWQKKALVIDDTITNMMIRTQNPIVTVMRRLYQTTPKGSRIKTKGSKGQVEQGRKGKGSKDGTQCVSGENILGKVMFLSLSSRTSEASYLGGCKYNN